MASDLSGLAAGVTFALLGWLVHDQHMGLAVAGIAVVGVRTGTSLAGTSTTSTRWP